MSAPIHRLAALRGIRRPRIAKAVRLAGAALLVASLGGCGVAAFPCRLVSATLKIVPGVGDAAATPFDACASAID
ncbi:DUF6726 family protein [Trinickia caryophylli]|uniref:Uncharacterized protein n=1 Tax=Trinickia caryophylli TaxID=28094 RepID=A0A1X7F4J1_TRICW|nr:hypothetical protein SAMN06295900_107150 [Trinickia caryophylli]